MQSGHSITDINQPTTNEERTLSVEHDNEAEDLIRKAIETFNINQNEILNNIAELEKYISEYLSIIDEIPKNKSFSYSELLSIKYKVYTSLTAHKINSKETTPSEFFDLFVKVKEFDAINDIQIYNKAKLLLLYCRKLISEKELSDSVNLKKRQSICIVTFDYLSQVLNNLDTNDNCSTNLNFHDTIKSDLKEIVGYCIIYEIQFSEKDAFNSVDKIKFHSDYIFFNKNSLIEKLKNKNNNLLINSIFEVLFKQIDLRIKDIYDGIKEIINNLLNDKNLEHIEIKKYFFGFIETNYMYHQIFLEYKDAIASDNHQENKCRTVICKIQKMHNSLNQKDDSEKIKFIELARNLTLYNVNIHLILAQLTKENVDITEVRNALWMNNSIHLIFDFDYFCKYRSLGIKILETIPYLANIKVEMHTRLPFLEEKTIYFYLKQFIFILEKLTNQKFTNKITYDNSVSLSENVLNSLKIIENDLMENVQADDQQKRKILFLFTESILELLEGPPLKTVEDLYITVVNKHLNHIKDYLLFTNNLESSYNSCLFQVYLDRYNSIPHQYFDIKLVLYEDVFKILEEFSKNEANINEHPFLLEAFTTFLKEVCDVYKESSQSMHPTVVKCHVIYMAINLNLDIQNELKEWEDYRSKNQNSKLNTYLLSHFIRPAYDQKDVMKIGKAYRAVKEALSFFDCYDDDEYFKTSLKVYFNLFQADEILGELIKAHDSRILSLLKVKVDSKKDNNNNNEEIRTIKEHISTYLWIIDEIPKVKNDKYKTLLQIKYILYNKLVEFSPGNSTYICDLYLAISKFDATNEDQFYTKGVSGLYYCENKWIVEDISTDLDFLQNKQSFCETSINNLKQSLFSSKEIGTDIEKILSSLIRSITLYINLHLFLSDGDNSKTINESLKEDYTKYQEKVENCENNILQSYIKYSLKLIFKNTNLNNIEKIKKIIADSLTCKTNDKIIRNKINTVKEYMKKYLEFYSKFLIIEKEYNISLDKNSIKEYGELVLKINNFLNELRKDPKIKDFKDCIEDKILYMDANIKYFLASLKKGEQDILILKKALRECNTDDYVMIIDFYVFCKYSLLNIKLYEIIPVLERYTLLGIKSYEDKIKNEIKLLEIIKKLLANPGFKEKTRSHLGLSLLENCLNDSAIPILEKWQHMVAILKPRHDVISTNFTSVLMSENSFTGAFYQYIEEKNFLKIVELSKEFLSTYKTIPELEKNKNSRGQKSREQKSTKAVLTKEAIAEPAITKASIPEVAITETAITKIAIYNYLIDYLLETVTIFIYTKLDFVLQFVEFDDNKSLSDNFITNLETIKKEYKAKKIEIFLILEAMLEFFQKTGLKESCSDLYKILIKNHLDNMKDLDGNEISSDEDKYFLYKFYIERYNFIPHDVNEDQSYCVSVYKKFYELIKTNDDTDKANDILNDAINKFPNEIQFFKIKLSLLEDPFKEVDNQIVSVDNKELTISTLPQQLKKPNNKSEANSKEFKVYLSACTILNSQLTVLTDYQTKYKNEKAKFDKLSEQNEEIKKLYDLIKEIDIEYATSEELINLKNNLTKFDTIYKPIAEQSKVILSTKKNLQDAKIKFDDAFRECMIKEKVYKDFKANKGAARKGDQETKKRLEENVAPEAKVTVDAKKAEAERKKQEEAIAKKAAEVAAERKRQEEITAKKAAAAEAERKKREEAAAKKAAAVAAERKRQEEAAAKKAAAAAERKRQEEAAERKVAEEAARIAAAEEEAARIVAAEEAAARIAAEEEAARVAAEEEAARIAVEEEAARIAAEEAARIAAEEEAARIAAEEAARIAVEEEAAARIAAEEAEAARIAAAAAAVEAEAARIAAEEVEKESNIVKDILLNGTGSKINDEDLANIYKLHKALASLGIKLKIKGSFAARLAIFLYNSNNREVAKLFPIQDIDLVIPYHQNNNLNSIAEIRSKNSYVIVAKETEDFANVKRAKPNNDVGIDLDLTVEKSSNTGKDKFIPFHFIHLEIIEKDEYKEDDDKIIQIGDYYFKLCIEEGKEKIVENACKFAEFLVCKPEDQFNYYSYNIFKYLLKLSNCTTNNMCTSNASVLESNSNLLSVDNIHNPLLDYYIKKLQSQNVKICYEEMRRFAKGMPEAKKDLAHPFIQDFYFALLLNKLKLPGNEEQYREDLSKIFNKLYEFSSECANLFINNDDLVKNAHDPQCDFNKWKTIIDSIAIKKLNEYKETQEYKDQLAQYHELPQPQQQTYQTYHTYQTYQAYQQQEYQQRFIEYPKFLHQQQQGLQEYLLETQQLYLRSLTTHQQPAYLQQPIHLSQQLPEAFPLQRQGQYQQAQGQYQQPQGRYQQAQGQYQQPQGHYQPPQRQYQQPQRQYLPSQQRQRPPNNRQQRQINLMVQPQGQNLAQQQTQGYPPNNREQSQINSMSSQQQPVTSLYSSSLFKNAVQTGSEQNPTQKGPNTFPNRNSKRKDGKL